MNPLNGEAGNGNDRVWCRIEVRNEVTGGVSHVGPYATEAEAFRVMAEKALTWRRFITLQVCLGKGECLIGARVRGTAP